MEEQYILRLFLVVAKNLRHKHYNHTLEKHTEYMALVAGVGLEKMLKQYVRREEDELFKQRVALTNSIVTSVSENLLDPFNKVPRSNSGRRILAYKQDNQTSLQQLEDILAKFWGEESWDTYMEVRFNELNATDPNSFIVFEFKPFDNEVEAISPYSYEVSSSMAVDYKYDNGELKYLIAKDSHNYKIKEDLVRDTAVSTSALPKDETKKGSKYTLYLENRTIQLKQVSEREETGLSTIKEAVVTQLGTEGRAFVKLGKDYYEYLDFTPHNLKRVPAVRVGYYRDLATYGETYVSPIHAAIPFLKKTIKTDSELDLVATLLAHPQMIRYAEPCTDTNCFNGYYEDNTVCKTCKGTGVKATAPSSQDAITLRMPESREEMLPLGEIIKYISPPVDVVKWQDEYVDKLTERCKKFMYNDGLYSKTRQVKTATEKDIDMDNVYDKLYPFAVKYGKTWTLGVKIVADLADRKEGLVVSYTFSKDFKLKTLDTLIRDLEVANNIGSPILTRSINTDIANILYREQPLELQRYHAKELFNPFSGKTDKEILILISGGLVSRKDKVLYANFGRIFDELELEANGVDLYGLNRSELKKRIDDKVKKIIEELEEENPAPILPE